MTDDETADYGDAAAVDVEDLADQLPSRPLTHEETQDLADRLAWSFSTVTHETESGREYVPEMLLFRPTERTDDGEDWRGDALGLHMDDRMTEWIGEVEREDVTHSQWIQVIEAYGRYRGGNTSVQSMIWEREDGTTVRRDLRD